MTQSLTDITSLDTGPLGIYHLRRMWARARLVTQGITPEKDEALEWRLDNLAVDGLCLGLEPTLKYMYTQADDYTQFEAWVLEQNGGHINEQTKAHINQALLSVLKPGSPPPTPETLTQHPGPALNDAELAFFAEHGYVILKNAVSEENRWAAADAVWQHLGATPDNPESWYLSNADKQHIMVQLFHHPALAANRQSARIQRAFAQLWQTEHIWCSYDRVSFNPPERPGAPFPGPDLHWDAHFKTPFPFGLQGLLYLTDTDAEQGAFTCVPGFQHRIDQWLTELPPDADPQAQDLHALGSKPIPGKAGDMIIWHHALPHGSRPNRHHLPRLVQYIKMYPVVGGDLGP